MSPDDVERQIALERVAVDEGAARYRHQLESAKFSSSAPAQRIIDQVGAALTAQVQHFATFAGTDAFRPDWPALLAPPGPENWGLKPEVWAALVVQAVLAHPSLPTGIPALSLAFKIVARARGELAYQQWLESPTGRFDAAGQELTGADQDRLFRKLEQMGKGKASRRRQQALRNVARLDLGPRGHNSLKAKLGSALLHMLVIGSPEVFGLSADEITGGTTLMLTPAAKSRIRRLNDLIALASPSKLPLLCAPRRWTPSTHVDNYMDPTG